MSTKSPKPYSTEFVAPPPILPMIDWVSWDLYLAANSIAFNPAVITAYGRVRFRVRFAGTLNPWRYGVVSDYFGPGTGNQPTGLQAQVSGMVTGSLYEVELFILSGDVNYADNPWTFYTNIVPSLGGPYYLPTTP